MKRRSFFEKLRYDIDCFMSRGPIAMTLLLLGATVFAVVLIGLVAWLVGGEGGLFAQIWASLMHTLDAGNLAGNETTNIPYLITMSFATLCGLFLTSILIGIISTGVESKLNDLRKGTSTVLEQGHTTIVGFDNNVYSILSELIEANANKKDACIVILGTLPKTEMEEAINAHFPDTRTTRIICRSGGLHEMHALALCSLETCRSVIVNISDDAETVKAVLAISAYLKDKELTCPDLHIIAALQDSQFMEAARIAGEGRACIIYSKDAIARIIANTCRQHGLSQVLTEIFNFGGNELYFESIPDMVGKTMEQALLCFSNAVVVGIFSKGQAKLNPPMDTVIRDGDQLIMLERDDGDYLCHKERAVNEEMIAYKESSDTGTNHLVILGSNDKLPIILTEYDHYVMPDTRVIIVDDDFEEESLSDYKNLRITVRRETVNRKLLTDLLETNQNILLLNDDSRDAENSDSQTLLRLILLRDIADSTSKQFSITTEMRSVDNQRLASQARVDDFVIGSNFSCLLMAQISENRTMESLITELLDESGSELYMKPAENYVTLGKAVDLYTLTESAARKGEIFIGYRQLDGKRTDVVVNPTKDKTVTFGKDDKIVVIAEN